ncbi:MAG: ATP-binding protein [Chitinispirillales bacterium]|nr:ATP-binding protein [Chitinispirillales bacterium]
MAQSDKETIYDESKIQTLDSLEHIRLRSGMYIGRLGNGNQYDDGIYVLLKEVIDNSIDEFIMKNGDKIEVELKENLISVRDYGRGIPLGKLVDCVSKINTGAKYNTEVFQFSVGLNGVGTKAVNALSSYFKVKSFRDGKCKEAVFETGKLQKETDGLQCENATGTYFEFIPDMSIFGEYQFNKEFIEQRLWSYAYLNRGLKLFFNGQKFESRGGLKDLLIAEVGDDRIYDICYFNSKDSKLEFAFTHTEQYGDGYFSYVNGQHTSAGGTHESAFREGILKGIREYSGKNYDTQDVRDGIVGAISIRLENPIFESQTKNKLGNTNIRGDVVNAVKDAIADFLHKHSDTAEILIAKIERNEQVRKELSEVKRKAKDNAKKISINIPGFKDCKYHLPDGIKGENSTIFITEGKSAGGSITSTRDVFLQAMFPLRGKPKNLFGCKKTDIYNNEEMYNLVTALGIEDSLDNLRYGKVVIATDADVDGFHIRLLMMTFFLNYFEELVLENRIFILETPLFRVRNKKETRYCYSISERDKAEKSMKDCEITRFKGLGEIDTKEFGQFIGKDMRLTEINIKTMAEIHRLMKFYMGQNTSERRDYIIENLI